MKYVLPIKYQEKILYCLEDLGFSIKSPGKIAEAILRLSDHYQAPLAQTPWSEPWAQAAYVSYYLPLNYIRWQGLLGRVPESFFSEGLGDVVDFGFGLGAASLALHQHGVLQKVIAVESTPEAQQVYESLSLDLQPQWAQSWSKATSTAVFSYSLNELEQIPEWLFESQNLLIMEPSTQLQGRRLMGLREELIAKGFSIWAPCTHQGSCPLLHQSKKDWCHDRVHWEVPKWFQRIEAQLPIKNKTLTHSYLVASRRPAPQEDSLGRVVGDELKEKGKTRWMFCHNEERLFLSWLQRRGESPKIHRGEVLELNPFERKGHNELRWKPSE